MQHLDNSIFPSSCRHFAVNCSHKRGNNFLKKITCPDIFSNRIYCFCWKWQCIWSLSIPMCKIILFTCISLFIWISFSGEESICQLYICIWVEGNKKRNQCQNQNLFYQWAVDWENKPFPCLFVKSAIVLFVRSLWGIEFLFSYHSIEDVNAW